MAIVLNIKNAEQFILSNKKIEDALSNYKSMFNTWYFASRIHGLKEMRINTAIQFIKMLKDDDLKIIQNILGYAVIKDINLYNSCLHFGGNIDNIEFFLPTDFNTIDICVYRKKDSIGVTLWN